MSCKCDYLMDDGFCWFLYMVVCSLEPCCVKETSEIKVLLRGKFCPKGKRKKRSEVKK